MLKITIGLKEDEGNINITLQDPPKKQLESATENEKILAQTIKNLLDTNLLNLLEDETNKKENE